MKFLVDAQLPRRLVQWLAAGGAEAIHTLDLPKGNRTTDRDVADIADRDDLVVVTKDADFVDAHLLHGAPVRLLLVSTGNITNLALEALFVPLIPAILRGFEVSRFIELQHDGLVVRG